MRDIAPEAQGLGRYRPPEPASKRRLGFVFLDQKTKDAAINADLCGEADATCSNVTLCHCPDDIA